jgi:hypothetical protein
MHLDYHKYLKLIDILSKRRLYKSRTFTTTSSGALGLEKKKRRTTVLRDILTTYLQSILNKFFVQTAVDDFFIYLNGMGRIFSVVQKSIDTYFNIRYKRFSENLNIYRSMQSYRFNTLPLLNKVSVSNSSTITTGSIYSFIHTLYLLKQDTLQLHLATFDTSYTNTIM